MSYIVGNPKTKKAAKDMIKNGNVTCFEPGIGSIPLNGKIFIEGPHYPAPHSWYAEGIMKDGKLVSIK